MKTIIKVHKFFLTSGILLSIIFHSLSQSPILEIKNNDNALNIAKKLNNETSNFFKSPVHLLQFFGEYSGRSTNFLRGNYNGGSTWNELRVLFPKFFATKGHFPMPYFSVLLKAQRDINWEDRADLGGGIEWRPLRNYGCLRLFSAYFTTVFLNYENTWGWRPRSDFRFGLELYDSNLYKEKIKGKNTFLYYEIWTELSFRTSNFFINNFDTWFLGFVPKVGLKFPANDRFFCIPYITGEFTLTGKLPQIDNSNFWTNRVLWGAGVKFLPFQHLKLSKLHLMLNRVHFYGEVLVVGKYLRTTPSNIPSKDWRFGVVYLINRISPD